RTVGSQLAHHPTAERKADDVDRAEPHILQHPGIETGQIPHTADPLNARRCAEARMERNMQRMTLCQCRVPAQPAWMSEFLMEHKQWPARATFDERELGTGDVHYALFPFLCVACHLLDNLLAVRDVAVCRAAYPGLCTNPFLLSSERRVKLGL